MKTYKLVFVVFFVLCLVFPVGSELAYQPDLVIKDLPATPADIIIYQYNYIDGYIYVLYTQPAIEVYDNNGLLRADVIWGPTLIPNSALSGFSIEEMPFLNEPVKLIWASDTAGKIYRGISGNGVSWKTEISDNSYIFGRIIKINNEIYVRARKRGTRKYYLLHFTAPPPLSPIQRELTLSKWAPDLELPVDFDFCISRDGGVGWNYLYISDKSHHKINKYNIAAKALENSWYVTDPEAVTCDGLGNVYVICGDPFRKIVKYDKSGNRLATLVSGDFSKLSSIALYKDYIYLVDRGKRQITRFVPVPPITTPIKPVIVYPISTTTSTTSTVTSTTTQTPTGTPTLLRPMPSPLIKR